MKMLERLVTNQTYLAVVGLGYVGLPLAVAFAEKVKTLGYDTDQKKITDYLQGIDRTGEIGTEKLHASKLELTADPSRLAEAGFIIVAVPTPVKVDKTPNLEPVATACQTIGQYLSPGAVIVFESTVYPGVTEDVCIPLLETVSGLVCGRDFTVGYSPERINAGDKVHRLENICKIVSAIDEQARETIGAVYELVVHGGIYKASSIKVAEAAKLAENAQRDVNIAFMNELAVVFERMGICTHDVLGAMNTKWNALGFSPGLVGGHCIGVDPYYFIYQSAALDYYPQMIAAGRQINDGMAAFIANNVIKKLIQADRNVKTANIYIMGITFKEDCPDMRNSKAIEICKHLAGYGIQVKVVDPFIGDSADKQDFSFPTVPLAAVKHADCLVFLVAHQQFKELQSSDLVKMCGQPQRHSAKVIIDVKSIFDSKALECQGFSYWSL